MTKALMLATAAVVAIAGAQAAHAQILLGPCAVEAAATQQECLAAGNPPGECMAYYQEDIAECYAYGNVRIGGPIGPAWYSAPRRVSTPRRVSAPHPAPTPRGGPGVGGAKQPHR